MLFLKTRLDGVLRVEMEPRSDDRGFFARTFCAEEFAEAGLEPTAVQSSISFNKRRGTLRGMHFQAPPYEEAKLVRCISGAIYDVVLDIRPHSPTFGQWEAFELQGTGLTSIYIGKGFAHGFQALADATCVLYSMSQYYHAESARGISPLDPTMNIPWPVPERILSDKDAALPALCEVELPSGFRIGGRGRA